MQSCRWRNQPEWVLYLVHQETYVIHQAEASPTVSREFVTWSIGESSHCLMGSLMRMSEHGIEPLQGLERAPLHVFDGPAIVLDHVDGVVAFDRSRMRVARGSAPSDAKGSTLVSTVTAGKLSGRGCTTSLYTPCLSRSPPRGAAILERLLLIETRSQPDELDRRGKEKLAAGSSGASITRWTHATRGPAALWLEFCQNASGPDATRARLRHAGRSLAWPSTS